MATNDDNPDPGIRKRMDFTATSWTAVVAASQPDTPEARAALDHLCRIYWYPLYAYARRRGLDEQTAEDMTQEFFHLLLRDNYLKVADRERGKFRSFLLSSMMHFLSNERRRAQAAKRGGKHTIISMDTEAGSAEDRYLKETIPDPSAVNVFEHGWATTLLHEVQEELRQEHVAAGKETVFDLLKPFLKEESSTVGYGEVSEALNMTPGAVAVAVHRLRQRYGELLRKAVAATLAEPTPAAVDAELRHLMAAVTGNLRG